MTVSLNCGTFIEKCNKTLSENSHPAPEIIKVVCNEAVSIFTNFSELQANDHVLAQLSDTLEKFTFSVIQQNQLNTAKSQLFRTLCKTQIGRLQIERLSKANPNLQDFKEMYTLEFKDGGELKISKAELITFGNFFITLLQSSMKENAEKKIKLLMDSEHFLIIRSFLRDEEVELEDPHTWWVLKTLSDFFLLEGVVLPSEPTFINARDAIFFTKNYGLPRLYLYKFPLEKHDLDQILTLTNLKELTIDNAAFQDGWIESLPDSIEFLLFLELENVTKITKTPKNLKTIKFLDCKKLKHLELHDNITSLCLISAVQTTLKLSQNLLRLVLLTPQVPDNLLENLPQTLREFNTSSIEFTDSLVSKLSRTLTKLQLWRCSELTDASIPLLSRSLIDLKIGNAPKLTKACIPSLPPFLKQLSLMTPGIHFDSGIVFPDTLEELHILKDSKMDATFESQLNPRIKLKKDL